MKSALKIGTRVCGSTGVLCACVLSLSGCRQEIRSFSRQNAPVMEPVQNRSPRNLASQIEVLVARVADRAYVSKSKPTVKETFPEILVKWRNNGPEPVGMVRAKLQTWDAKGKELPHSPTTVTIFFARSDARRIKANQMYDEPAGKGHALLFGPPKAVRAKATVVYADSAAHAWDDIHVGRNY